MLSRDICRCNDDDCFIRRRCKRWVYRNDGDILTVVESFRRGLDDCMFFIKENEDAPTQAKP